MATLLRMAELAWTDEPIVLTLTEQQAASILHALGGASEEALPGSGIVYDALSSDPDIHALRDELAANKTFRGGYTHRE